MRKQKIHLLRPHDDAVMCGTKAKNITTDPLLTTCKSCQLKYVGNEQWFIKNIKESQ